MNQDFIYTEIMATKDRLQNSPTPKIIIGLGNPGRRYENTYHNAGHLFIDYLDKNFTDELRSRKVVKTDCFMNNSGNFVKELIRNNGLKPIELLVVHDDSDIEIGKTKLSFGSGAAGHRGVQNIIDALGTADFWRLRIGIRPKEKLGQSRPKAEAFVLKKIYFGNKKILRNSFKKSAMLLGFSVI
jgi:aminoacyl-tRNA hydrolase